MEVGACLCSARLGSLGLSLTQSFNKHPPPRVSAHAPADPLEEALALGAEGSPSAGVAGSGTREDE